MILRWAAAGLEEAAKGFRRIRGYKELHRLVELLRQNDLKLDGIKLEDEADKFEPWWALHSRHCAPSG